MLNKMSLPLNDGKACYDARSVIEVHLIADTASTQQTKQVIKVNFKFKNGFLYSYIAIVTASSIYVPYYCDLVYYYYTHLYKKYIKNIHFYANVQRRLVKLKDERARMHMQTLDWLH